MVRPRTNPLNVPAQDHGRNDGRCWALWFQPNFYLNLCAGQRPTPLGLQLAKLADLPDDVLSEAARVTELLEEKYSAEKASSEAGRIAQRRKVFLRVMTTSPSPPCYFSGSSSWLLTFVLLSAPISRSSGRNSLRRSNILRYLIGNCWNTLLGFSGRQLPLFTILCPPIRFGIVFAVGR